MSSNDPTSPKSELASKIQQFLSYQIASGNLPEASRESLTVATECIEQAFGIQKKPASNELLDIYNSHKSRQTSAPPGPGEGPNPNPNPAALLQNIASSFLTGMGSAGMTGLLNNVAAGLNPNAAPSNAPTATATSGTESAPTPSAPKVRKVVSAEERIAAENLKNQGNDLMKQDMHRAALEYYTRAIEIDDNNAIYYSNRAAAHSKLGDHQAALNDCREAIEIDPTYSKAYGRLGLAYASLEQHQRAKEAYLKAVELDPSNESYKNNLKIAEETLAQQGANSAPGNNNPPGGQANMMNMLQNMMNNPEVMQMAMRCLQDPRTQSLFGLNGGGGGGVGGGQPNS